MEKSQYLPTHYPHVQRLSAITGSQQMLTAVKLFFNGSITSKAWVAYPVGDQLYRTNLTRKFYVCYPLTDHLFQKQDSSRSLTKNPVIIEIQPHTKIFRKRSEARKPAIKSLLQNHRKDPWRLSVLTPLFKAAYPITAYINK